MHTASVGFQDTNRHQDGQEWVNNLIDAIGNELPMGQKEEWKALFDIGIGGAYKCTAGHLQLKMLENHSALKVGIIDKFTGEKLLTTEQVMKNEFKKEKMDKKCNIERCGEVKAISSSHITSHPKLLILQYKRYQYSTNGTITKVKHSVRGTINLNISGIQYELVGLMQHLGEDLETGHYISVTR